MKRGPPPRIIISQAKEARAAIDKLKRWVREGTMDVKSASRMGVEYVADDLVSRMKLKVVSNKTYRTGALYTSIHREPPGVLSEEDDEVLVGPNVPYAIYIEMGTKPHIITPRTKKALYWKGAEHPVKKVHHPGTDAKPFVQPSFEEIKAFYKDIIVQTVRRNI